jgi:Family of unknown function (DUF5995)
MSPHARRLLTVTAILALLLPTWVAGSTATAADPIFIGWSQLLPAWAYSFSPTSQNPCAAGKSTCVQQTIKDMTRRYDPLLAACHHNAVFSLAYLMTTQEYAKYAAEPDTLQNTAFVNHEDAVFAQFYFQAYDSWAAGRRNEVPEAWQIAFDAAQNQQVSGSGNLLLGMNAHVNRDLPFVLAGIGMGLKSDHDSINEMLNRVVQPLLDKEAATFDQTMDDANTPYGLSYTALMQLLVSWRETAWRNAERLVAAPDAASRASIAQQIETYAADTARSLVLQYQYHPPVTTSADRNAFCASH